MNGNKLNPPLVSVIINCYNGQEYLREAIDSVYNQTYNNWEIIFWDNNSTDGSAEIAKSYGEKLIYFKSEINTTLGEARNEAIKRVNGKYITFIDCDDLWKSTKLEKQIILMESNLDLVLSYAGIEEILPDGSFFRYVDTIYKTGNIFKELLLQYDINILTSMIRKSLLIEANLSFDNNITASEEYCLFMQLACIYPIGIINEILAQYRVHETSLTSKSLEVLGKERRYTLDKIINEHPDIRTNLKKEFREAFARADYYDSRWFISKNNHWKAFRLLSRNSTINFYYFSLTIMSLLPFWVWNKVHLKFRNRI